MRFPNSEARAFVFGPLELSELLAAQFEAIGVQAEAVPTPQNEAEFSSWLSAQRAPDVAIEGEEASVPSIFVHPGLSFWADRPEFPQMVSAAGFFPVSPTARVLSLCLNKLNLLIEAESLGIPHLALSFDPLSTLREIEETLAKTRAKYPIVLKSLKVAQGHGLQVIHDQKQLREIVPIWFEQLSRRYGEASVLIERCLPSARHLVVPFAADGESFLEVFPALDASLQSQWRRMIQFIPATDLDPGVMGLIEEGIRKWTKKLGFSGFGSMEILVDGAKIYLIDANARLNAAFPLWEELLGIQTVEWQLAALGQLPLPSPRLKDRPMSYGAGVSLRFYAEDPVRQIPCPGKIRELSEPARWKEGSSSVTWMTRYRSGDDVSWASTGVLGELFVLDKDRKSALIAACKALDKVWIAGSLQTNRRFLLEHLEHPFVKENLIHAGFTDDDFIPEGFPNLETVREIVSIASALFPEEGSRWAVGNRWVEPEPEFVKKHGGSFARAHRFTVGTDSGASGVLSDVHGEVRFHFEPTHQGRWLVTYGTWTVALRRIHSSLVEGEKSQQKSRKRKVLALAPGRVHALLRHVGETVQAHDRICMIESTGVLVSHAIPLPSKLVEWKVSSGEIVEAGHELAVLELLS